MPGICENSVRAKKALDWIGEMSRSRRLRGVSVQPRPGRNAANDQILESMDLLFLMRVLHTAFVDFGVDKRRKLRYTALVSTGNRDF